MGPTTTYIHTEGMCKTWQINVTLMTVDDIVKKNVIGFKGNHFSFGIQQYQLSNHTCA
jgi:hypothetical protein